MQIFVRGAAELLPLDLEKDDTIHDIRVSCTSAAVRSDLDRVAPPLRNMSLKNTISRWMNSS